jgi:glycosyltransferase involved in cell wall biosynthesis
MTAPKITVYIASRNYGRFLADAVESVLRQKREDWELLLIDDASTDDTKDVMALYRGDPRIRLFETPGIGLPAVCNLALKEARGEYLIRLDGDDVFDENILLVLGAWLDKEPELALVFPDYYLMDEFGEVYAQERREPLAQKNHLLDMPPNGACTLVKKDVVLALGGYREDLGAQDGFDLWSKIVKSHKFANVNLPLFYYRRHGHNLTNNSHRILSARRQIKRDAILGSLTSFKPFIAVIPCRENYDFCKNVWKLELGKRTLLQRDIEACLASPILDYVVVASDTGDVRAVMDRYDDPRLRFFQRKPSDTIRSKSIVATLEKIAEEYDPDLRGVTVLSYIQAPFVTTDTLEEAIFTVVMNQTDGSIGVEEIDSPVHRRTPYGLRAVNPPRTLSTDFDRVYREASTALAARNRNFKSGSLTGPSVVHFVVSPDECFFISSEKTLKIARAIAEER